MKRINIKKPSSFFVKSKSQVGIRRDQRKVTDLNSRVERDMDLYMTGKISKEELIRRKELNGAELEKIIDKSYMKTYSVLVTEEELRLFSEFLEQKYFSEDEDYEEFLRETGTYFHSPDFDRERAEIIDRTKESARDHHDYGSLAKSNSYEIAKEEMSNNMRKASNADLYLYRNPEVENTELGKKIRENSNKIWEREGNSWHSDKAKERRERRASDWDNTLRMEGKFREDSVDNLLNDYKEKRKTDSSKKYNPKTDKPLVEIKDVPIIIDEPEKEDTTDLTKFQRDRKKESLIRGNIKDIPTKVSDYYKEDTSGRSLGKDAAIAAGVTAGLVGGGIALRKYLKKKKAEKEIAEKKYKTSDKKKK